MSNIAIIFDLNFTQKENNMSSKKKSEEKKVSIPGVNVKRATLTIEGLSPLLVNKFSSKARQEIADKQQGAAKAKKAFRNPEAEYKESLYVIPGTKKYGIPAGGLKNAAVTAAKYCDGISQAFAMGAFHVVGGAGNLVEVKGKPVMDESIVRIGGFGKKVAMPRYRGRFDDWSIEFQVTYNENVISAEQIANLYENAGFSIGLCEWRPEKRGSMGMFRIKR